MTKEYSDFLAHYGVKGQKKGVRRYQNEDGSLTPEGRNHYGVGDQKDMKRLKKDAQKDAKEFAIAKAYYGDGAGIRRRKIKNLISDKMKDPDYKAEFERQLSLQNMEKVQHKANRERKVNTAKDKTAQTARGVKNFMLGNAVPMTTAAIAIGATLKYTGAGKKIAGWAGRSIRSIAEKGGRVARSAGTKMYRWKLRRGVRVR